MDGHRCKNLDMAACAGFIGFAEYVRLALLAVCSGHPAGQIEGDFEFLPAPVDWDIRDRVDEIAGCSGFVRSGAEPRSDLNARGIRCGEVLRRLKAGVSLARLTAASAALMRSFGAIFFAASIASYLKIFACQFRGLGSIRTPFPSCGFVQQRLGVGALEIFGGLSTSIGCLAIPIHGGNAAAPKRDRREAGSRENFYGRW